MAHHGRSWVNSRAKSAIGFADVVQKGDRGESGTSNIVELSQPSSAGETEIEGWLGQQRLDNCGDISRMVDQAVPAGDSTV
jgi:hypothetical protein